MTNQERINNRLQALWASHSQYGNDAAFVMELANQMQTLMKEVREDSAQIAKDFTDWKWSKHDPWARMEDGTTSILTDDSMEALAQEILKTGDL